MTDYITVRMKHPLHGMTHAFTIGELESLKKQGWVEAPKKQEPEAKKRGRPRRVN